ncbi:hypothetical protein DEA06_05125 [Microbacterium sp. Gd 4-13]|uniref:hypothetical protein n=1 Tax=Microbacterium sp. Gd 4-13 TaxID=2173179 RepID=UPI000D57F24C|nr:hypothetical protein [Microbacterium sp. Gd 4-13]PVW05150.1 hypothetical protein DEA06_05125 [Microbacterium sp. Gd 4-13]
MAEDAQHGLLEKYAAGVAFEDASGGTPVTVENYRLGITDYTRSVFADGSVALESVERPDIPTTGTGGPSARGISGCAYQLSAGVATYSNCKVEKSITTLTMWFRGGHWRYAGGHGASVTNTWGWDIQAVGASCAFQSLQSVTSTQARLRASCTVAGGWGSTNPWVELQSTSTGANVNANW